MQCDRKMFGLEEDVIVGAAYIKTHKVVIFLFAPFKLILLTCLRTRLVLFRCLLMSYCVMTFNTHVGELSEVSDAHTGFVLDCPEVLETRRYVCNSVNKAG